jgi:hypothetical protein
MLAFLYIWYDDDILVPPPPPPPPLKDIKKLKKAEKEKNLHLRNIVIGKLLLYCYCVTQCVYRYINHSHFSCKEYLNSHFKNC